MVIQVPLFAGMYAALRRVLDAGARGSFLWIRDIARVDIVLSVLVALLSYVVVANSPQSTVQSAQILALVSACITLLFLLRFSAAYGIYWGASTMISGVQGLLLRVWASRDRMRAA